MPLVLTIFFISSLLDAKQRQFQIKALVGYVMYKEHVVHLPRFFGINPSRIVVKTRVGPAFSIKKCLQKDGRIGITERFEAGAIFEIQDSLGRSKRIECTVYQTENGLEECQDSNKKIPRVLYSVVKKLLKQSVAEYYTINPKYKKMLCGIQTKKKNKLRYIKASD